MKFIAMARDKIIIRDEQFVVHEICTLASVIEKVVWAESVNFYQAVLSWLTLSIPLVDEMEDALIAGAFGAKLIGVVGGRSISLPKSENSKIVVKALRRLGASPFLDTV